MKLSKEQKDQVISRLSYPYGSVSLMCDGYSVTLQVRHVKGLTYRVVTYVNGWFKSEWAAAENACPEQKFLRKTVRPLASAKHKKEMEKIMGKRCVAKDPYYSATFTYYMFDWASGKAALSHLCKVCESVQVVEEPASATQEAP